MDYVTIDNLFCNMVINVFLIVNHIQKIFDIWDLSP